MSLTAEQMQEVWHRIPVRTRIYLRTLDIFLGGGITITERFALSAQRGEWIGKEGCRIFDSIDPGHCKRALEFPTKR